MFVLLPRLKYLSPILRTISVMVCSDSRSATCFRSVSCVNRNFPFQNCLLFASVAPWRGSGRPLGLCIWQIEGKRDSPHAEFPDWIRCNILKWRTLRLQELESDGKHKTWCMYRYWKDGRGMKLWGLDEMKTWDERHRNEGVYVARVYRWPWFPTWDFLLVFCWALPSRWVSLRRKLQI